MRDLVYGREPRRALSVDRVERRRVRDPSVQRRHPCCARTAARREDVWLTMAPGSGHTSFCVVYESRDGAVRIQIVSQIVRRMDRH